MINSVNSSKPNLVLNDNGRVANPNLVLNDNGRVVAPNLTLNENGRTANKAGGNVVVVWPSRPETIV